MHVRRKLTLRSYIIVVYGYSVMVVVDDDVLLRRINFQYHAHVDSDNFEVKLFTISLGLSQAWIMNNNIAQAASQLQI